MSDPDNVVPRFNWSDVNVATLKDLWQRGFTASKIAWELGYPVTRSGVLGKIHRLRLGGLGDGLPRAPTAASDAPRQAQPHRNGGAAVAAIKAAANRRAVKDAIEYAPVPDSDADMRIPLRQRVTLFELTADTCRWPVGEPGEPGFYFCGGMPVYGQSYCAGHCARAHQPRKMNLSDAERQRRSAQSRVNQRNRQQPQFGI